NALKDVSGALTSKTASSSQPAILTASAQSSAISSNHLITVNNLATTSTYYTDPVAGGALGQGSFTLTAGQSVLSVPVNAASTLPSVADFINGKNLGVTANVISDSSGSRLAIISNNSGSSGDFSITGNQTGLVFHKPVTGTDAAITVDGVPVSSASNT